LSGQTNCLTKRHGDAAEADFKPAPFSPRGLTEDATARRGQKDNRVKDVNEAAGLLEKTVLN